jgi:KUP system potassium uptake protein
MNRSMIVLLGLCGTALFAANGIITPSISVLSAVEGLQVAAPRLERTVIPLTMAILAGIFFVQKRGTAIIGSWFGPIMLFWFAAIAALGVNWIIQEPKVLMAVNPLYAVRFFAENRMHGLIVLGAVVLCVTGCEALYADLGHFGRRPITLAWTWIVFPDTSNPWNSGPVEA